MRFIEPFEFAPEWLQAIVKLKIAQYAENPDCPVREPRGVAFFQTFESLTSASETYARERRCEMTAMLRGLRLIGRGPVSVFTATGRDLHKLDVGFPAAGAQFSQLFRIIIV
jgi:hypothetical protein